MLLAFGFRLLNYPSTQKHKKSRTLAHSMGKRVKKLKSKSDHETEDEKQGPKTTPSNAAEDPNDDLILKIVEKAMLRRRSTSPRNDGVLNKSDSPVALVSAVQTHAVFDESNIDGEIVTDTKHSNRKKKKKKNKKKKIPKTETQNNAGQGHGAEEEDEAETGKVKDVDESVETNPVNPADNIVLRKLLRGPRYFDPPDSGWTRCYNCGEEGHITVNCTSAKRNKPCFFCGSLEHDAKQCAKAKDCFICKKGGHRAKDCPEKHKAGTRMCLKCGDSGHHMFSCKNDYCSDDLKEIQCYICKSFGHLCCVNYSDTGLREVSCYRCGQLGHDGLSCKGSRKKTSGMGSREKTSGMGSGKETSGMGSGKETSGMGSGKETSGMRPGKETSGMGSGKETGGMGSKVSKRKRELSTPTRKIPKQNKSTPHDLGNVGKKKKTQHVEERSTMSAKAKPRGGLITGDIPHYNPTENGWRSPATPTNWNSNLSTLSAGGYSSSSFANGWTSPATPTNRSSNMSNLSAGGHSSSSFANGWRSPATPTNWNSNMSNLSAGGYSSSSFVNGWRSPATPTNWGSNMSNLSAGGHSSSSFANGWRSPATPTYWNSPMSNLPAGSHSSSYFANGWRSPGTLTYWNSPMSTFTAGGQASVYISPINNHRLYFANSSSPALANFPQQRFSASRFDNSSSYGMRPNFNR